MKNMTTTIASYIRSFANIEVMTRGKKHEKHDQHHRQLHPFFR